MNSVHELIAFFVQRGSCIESIYLRKEKQRHFCQDTYFRSPPTQKKICNFFCKGRPAITWSQQETNESGGSTRLNSKIWHWSPRYRVLRGRSGQDPVTTMHNTGWTNHSSGLVWILRFWICDHIGAINSHFPVYEAIFSMVRMANRVILKQACSWPVVTQEDYAGCLCHILHIGYTQIEAKL